MGQVTRLRSLGWTFDGPGHVLVLGRQRWWTRGSSGRDDVVHVWVVGRRRRVYCFGSRMSTVPNLPRRYPVIRQFDVCEMEETVDSTEGVERDGGGGREGPIRKMTSETLTSSKTLCQENYSGYAENPN